MAFKIQGVSVGSLLKEVLPPLFSKKDFLYTTLALDWSTVVGEELARQTFPLRIVREGTGGILYAMLSYSHGLSAVYSTQAILERVNGYLGYKAISRVIFRQDTGKSWKPPSTVSTPRWVETASPKPALNVCNSVPRPFSPALQGALEEVVHEGLRMALIRLAGSMGMT